MQSWRIVSFAALSLLILTSAGFARDVADRSALTLYRGTVEVDVIQGRGVGVGIDIPAHGETVGDGAFDRLIVLEAYGKTPKEFPLRLRDAYVAISAGRALVVDLYGPRVVDLRVDQPGKRGALDGGEMPSEILLTRSWSGTDERMAFTGFGLAEITVQTRVIDNGSWANRPPSARNACTDGATQCSVSGCPCPGGTCPNGSGCSITCSNNTDACCICTPDGGDCFCTHIGDGGGGGDQGGGGDAGGCQQLPNGYCPAPCFRCTAY